MQRERHQFRFKSEHLELTIETGLFQAVGDSRTVAEKSEHTALGGQFLYLLLKDAGLDEHTVAYKVDFILVENARRDDMKHMLHAVELESVTGVGAALETGNNIIVGGEDINDFTFALVAPLKS